MWIHAALFALIEETDVGEQQERPKRGAAAAEKTDAGEVQLERSMQGEQPERCRRKMQRMQRMQRSSAA